MMNEADVKKCFIEQKILDKVSDSTDNEIQFIPYDISATVAKLLPEEVHQKYCANYSRDEAVVIYSSGTTGKAKGIILTHSSTITGELLVALKTRTPILIAPVVVPPRFVLSNIVKYSVTIIGVNPLLLSMYCEECRNREYDLSSLKKIYVSGSILSDKIFEMVHHVFHKQKVYNVYGLSEAGPRVAAQRFDCCKGNSVSNGRLNELIRRDNDSPLEGCVFFYIVEYINNIFDDCIKQFRIIQNGYHEFEAIFSVEDKRQLPDVEKTFIYKAAQYGLDVNWKFTYVDNIVPEENGKLRYFISCMD